MYMPSNTPVSYTHLDVYKRQLSDIAPLFVMAGVIMVMFCKKLSIKRAGEVVLGFGILFMGLSLSLIHI